jgi:hypothetical protein
MLAGNAKRPVTVTASSCAEGGGATARVCAEAVVAISNTAAAIGERVEFSDRMAIVGP